MLPSIFGENLFDDLFGDPFELIPTMHDHDPLYGKHVKNIMKTDVKELDNSYQLCVDLPGFKKENVSVELNDGYLTISASKGLNRDEEDEVGRYIRRERYTGSCSRSFYVGDVRQEDISAKFENGILKLTMPKTTRQELPRRNMIAIE